MTDAFEPSPKFVALVDAIIAQGHTCQSVLRRLDARLAQTPLGPGRDNLLAFRQMLVEAMGDTKGSA